MADEETSLQSLEFLPENLSCSLLDFQRHGIRFGISNKGRCLIGDEMGLGKTLQAISIAYYYKDEWPMLIVVPSSVKYPWIEEIEKWITDLEPGDINLIRSGTDIGNISTSKISILGYGLCGDRRSSKLLVNALRKQAFKVIILDESHYLKNRHTGRTKLLHPIAKSAKRIILLTGTPSLARPEELYIQLDIVRPGVFGSFSNFANRYCEAHYENLGKFRKWNTRGACRLDELHKRLNNGIMIRRLKKNVLTQLPPKRRQKITFDLPESDYKKDLFQAKAEFKKHHKTLGKKETSPQKKSEAVFELNRLSTVLYHYTGIAKAGSVQQYISDLLDGMDNKFIVFCRHRQVITAVIQQLTKKHVKYIHIDGSVPAAIRGTLVNQFQNNPSTRVAVLAIEAASFGLTLTAADHVVFAELHYTPGVMMQAEDRAHRIGQVNAVNVHYLVGRGTLDEVLWAMLRRKIYVTSSALDGKLDELHADEGDEETAKQLSACAAWLREESEDNEEDIQGYLFSQKSKKSRKHVEGQQDVRAYFTPPISGTSHISISDSDDEIMEVPLSLEKAERKDSPIKMSIEESSEEDDDEYNEDELANMLIEENDSGSDTSSNKAVKIENKQSSYLVYDNGKESEKPSASGKINKAVTNSTSKHLNAHLYECSEITDSEEIFQSYISTDVVDNGEDGDDDDDDDDDDVQMSGSDKSHDRERSLSMSSPSSNTQNDEKTMKKTPENLDVMENSLGTSATRKDCMDVDNNGNRNSIMKCLEDEEDGSRKVEANSTERSLRNPFSLKRKRVSKASCCEVTGSDSDEDFLTPMPKSFPEQKNDLEAVKSQENRSSISNGENSLDSTSHSICITEKRSLPKKMKGKSKSHSRIKDRKAPWSCRACTFINDPQMIECSICFTKRLQEFPTSKNEESVTNVSHVGKQNVDSVEAIKKFPSKVLQSEEYFSGASTNTEVSRVRNEDYVMNVEENSSVGLSNRLRKPDQEKKNIKLPSTYKEIFPIRSFEDKDEEDFRESLLQWSCSACTMLNDSMLIECCVCFTPRRRSQRKTKSEWSTFSCEKRRRERKEKSSSKRRAFKAEKMVDDVEIKVETHMVNEHVEEQREGDTELDGRPVVSKEAYLSAIEANKQTRTRKRLNLEDQDEWTFVNFKSHSFVGVEKAKEDQSSGFEGKKENEIEDKKIDIKVDFEEKECPSGSNDMEENSGKKQEGPDEEKAKEDESEGFEGKKNNETEDKKIDMKVVFKEEEGPSGCVDVEENSGQQQQERTDEEKAKEDESKGFQGKKENETEDKKIEMKVGFEGKEAPSGYVDMEENSGQQQERTDEDNNREDESEGFEGKKKNEIEGKKIDIKLSFDGQEDLPGCVDMEENSGQAQERTDEDPFILEFTDSDATDDDEMVHDGKKTSSCNDIPYRTSRETRDTAYLMKQKTAKDKENKHELDVTEHDMDDSLSETKKPDSSESLEELQKAAEQLFANDDGIIEHLNTNNLDTCIGETSGSIEDPSVRNETVDSATKSSDLVVKKAKDPPEPMILRFALSQYTDRVYLYDENDQHLQCNFLMSDVKNNNREDLPHILQHDYNFKQAKRLLMEWDRLGVQQKRVLSKSKLVFKNPLDAYHTARGLRSEGLTNVRHTNKGLRLQKVINAALEVGGKVRLVTRTPVAKKRKRTPTKNDGSPSNVRKSAEETSGTSSKEFSCVQAFGPDGIPLCLFCKAPVDYGTLGNEWDSRFCSHDCKENYQIRISGYAVRRNLFEAEQGVCQLCQFDAYACFQSVKSLQKKDRRAFLEKSVYSDLPSQLLNRMIVDPKEGMFWEADHIVAVVEGGGECGMENFRTLCVPCHKKVTRELLQRLKTKRQRLHVAGSISITSFTKTKS